MNNRNAISHLFRYCGVVLAFLLIVGQATAQEADKKLYFGPKVTGNFSNIYNSAGPTGAAHLGYGAGGFVQYSILGILSASLEVQYLQMGSDQQFGITYANYGDTDIGADLVTHNIDVPVLAHVYAPFSLGNMRLKAVVGPSFTYNYYSVAKSDQYLTLGSSTWPVATKENRSGDFIDFETAGLIGAGAEMPVGNFMLFADLRYRIGFQNVTDIVSRSVVNDDTNTLNALMVSVGLGF